VGIADDAKIACPSTEGNLRAVFNQQTPNTAPPYIRLNEQAVQFRIAVRSGLQRGKAGETAVQFQYEHISGRDLLDWLINSIRIGEQRCAVAFVRKRGAELQCLQCRLFRDDGRANVD